MGSAAREPALGRRWSRRSLLAALAVVPVTSRALTTDDHPIKVVYQISEGSEQAHQAIINIGNHLDASPHTKIVVVVFGKGIDFLVDGAKDPHGNPFDAAVAGATQRGVEFRVCQHTLDARGLTTKQINPEASVVASGVAEITVLQAVQHYAYLRP